MTIFEYLRILALPSSLASNTVLSTACPPLLNPFTRTVMGLHFYDSMLFIELGQHPASNAIQKGTALTGRRTVPEEVFLALPCQANLTADVPVTHRGGPTTLRVPLGLYRIDSSASLRRELFAGESAGDRSSIPSLTADGLRLSPPPGYARRNFDYSGECGGMTEAEVAAHDVIDYVINVVVRPECGVREKSWKD